MKRLTAVAVATASLCCVLPAAAQATTYSATITSNLLNGDGSVAYPHTYVVTADCASDEFSGVSTVTAGDNPEGETITGSLAGGLVTGHAVYLRADGLHYDFVLTPNADGTSYTGTWNGWNLLGTLSTTKVSACAAPQPATVPDAKTKDQCKKDGWKVVSRRDNSKFKNQGDCVSYVETGV